MIMYMVVMYMVVMYMVMQSGKICDKFRNTFGGNHILKYFHALWQQKLQLSFPSENGSCVINVYITAASLCVYLIPPS